MSPGWPFRWICALGLTVFVCGLGCSSQSPPSVPKQKPSSLPAFETFAQTLVTTMNASSLPEAILFGNSKVFDPESVRVGRYSQLGTIADMMNQKQPLSSLPQEAQPEIEKLLDVPLLDGRIILPALPGYADEDIRTLRVATRESDENIGLKQELFVVFVPGTSSWRPVHAMSLQDQICTSLDQKIVDEIGRLSEQAFKEP